jgi:hypothetical protein
MHPQIPKGLSLGLGFQFFEHLSLSLNILQISCKFRIRKLEIKKKLVFEYGSILIFFLIFKIDTKNLIFYFILNYLIRNLQEICKKSKLKVKYPKI